MRVIVADRDTKFLGNCQASLEDGGHLAQTAQDGLECLSVIRQFGPNLLILSPDILWGGGYGVLARMQVEPQMATIPVIMLSKASQRPPTCLTDQIVHWLAKPFRDHQLLIAIDAIDAARHFNQNATQ